MERRESLEVDSAASRPDTQSVRSAFGPRSSDDTVSYTSASVREFQTWFGSPDNPLYGSVHLPASGSTRGAVVVCPPLAKEQIATYRGLRQLAHLLASAGYLVLRFDYRGQGDSSGDQRDPDAVDGWLDSVRSAVAYVRSAGNTDVSLVGVRAGAMLASAVASTVGPVSSIVLLDPVLAGRRYVREQSAQYTVSVGAAEARDSHVSFLGAVFAEETVRTLSTMSVDAASVSASVPRVLAVLRNTDAEIKPVVGLLETAKPATIWSDDLETFVAPPSFILSVPSGLIAEIAEWLTLAPVREQVAVTPLVRTTARVAETPFGESVFETIDHLGPDHLLAVRTFTESCDTLDRLVVLHATAAEHRIGPGGAWVDTARALAEIGIPSLRFDRRGTGDSGEVSTNESTPPTSAIAREDISTMVHSLSVAPLRTVHAGVCSGAWHSAYVAQNHGAATVVLMNMVNWSFRSAGVPIRAAHVDAMNSRLADTLFRVARRARNGIRRAGALLPYSAWIALGRLGVVSAPEVILKPLANKGTRVVTMLSPEDHEWFVGHRGEQALDRIRSSGSATEVAVYDSGDHALLHRELRDVMVDTVVRTAAETYHLPTTHDRAVAPVHSEAL